MLIVPPGGSLLALIALSKEKLNQNQCQLKKYIKIYIDLTTPSILHKGAKYPPHVIDISKSLYGQLEAGVKHPNPFKTSNTIGVSSAATKPNKQTLQQQFKYK